MVNSLRNLSRLADLRWQAADRPTWSTQWAVSTQEVLTLVYIYMHDTRNYRKPLRKFGYHLKASWITR